MKDTTPTGPVDDEDCSTANSSDEALCELLGLEGLKALPVEEEDETDGVSPSSLSPPPQSLDDLLSLSEDFIKSQVEGVAEIYQREGVIVFPESLRIPPALMRRLTNELVYTGGGQGKDPPTQQQHYCDKTYETIIIVNNQTEQVTRSERVVTRLENFVSHHSEWYQLCHAYIQRCLSLALQQEHVLFKEKLNLKPPGGSGFAPHVDAPSLRIALGTGQEKNTSPPPRTFCTVMVAIDDMTTTNGCLRIAKGEWSEGLCPTIAPQANDNPDAGGRAGAIPIEATDDINFEDILCKGGTMVAFDGWVPHRSGPNQSPFPRRAVFLTYNPASEGDWHDAYYARMDQLRNDWRKQVGLATRDEQQEWEALQTIPRI